MQKEEKPRILSKEEIDYNIIHSKEEDSGGTYYLQIEKVQDYERYIQKQIEKV